MKGIALSPNSFCPNCGRWVDKLSEETGWCRDCTPVAEKELRNYLEANADEIEHYLLQGKSLSRAIDLVYRKNGRPHCISCGSVISRAPRNAVFCRARPECRRYSRRYVYLYQKKGMSKVEALAKVLEELT